MPRPHSERMLSSQAIKALAAIILTSLAGIILLSAWSIALRAGIAGANLDEGALNAGSADEALSILGNIAAAAVGGLVGWLTRDMIRVDQNTQTARDVFDAEASADERHIEERDQGS